MMLPVLSTGKQKERGRSLKTSARLMVPVRGLEIDRRPSMYRHGDVPLVNAAGYRPVPRGDVTVTTLNIP
jgi:hypothetical protein